MHWPWQRDGGKIGNERSDEAVSKVSRGSILEFKWGWRAFLLSVIGLAALTPLSDSPAINPSAAYLHADQTFIHGYLLASQKEAERGYSRSLYFAPDWARKFQLLEASAMVWRGLNEDALEVLDDNRIPWIDGDSKIQRLALQVTAFGRLHRFAQADLALIEGQERCAATASRQCGAILLAKGQMLAERGRIAEAKDSFADSLSFGQANHDGMLEATALLNLGQIATQRERHEEARAYYELSEQKAAFLSANAVLQIASGNQGWEEYKLGNYEKALKMLLDAARTAAALGDTGAETGWLTSAALAYADMGQFAEAERFDLRAIALARNIDAKQSIINATEDLARLYIRHGRPEEADRYAGNALALAQETGNRLDFIECSLLQGQAAALRRDWKRGGELLHGVSDSEDAPPSRKWQAEYALGRMYEAEGEMPSAESSYEAALAFVEGARASIVREGSRLTFLENATSIYGDYIHLLVSEGKTLKALEAADWSRARTLDQGLGSVARAGTTRSSGSSQFAASPELNPVQIARQAKSDLLFYWLGETQSYLWFITPSEMQFFTLPPKSEIEPVLERYRRSILALKDPLRQGGGEASSDAAALYRVLVGPGANAIGKDRPVVLFVDGPLGQLNFESLIVPSPTPHFWVEDATILSAPSIRMLAESIRNPRASTREANSMLLVGDTVAVEDFPVLPLAALEIEKVQAHFPSTSTVFQGAKATPAAYLASHPEQFGFIHFVTHGTASRTDPLDSAVVLSRDALSSTRTPEDSYKLYARQILSHPITARLVTLSACNSSGSKTVAGEGLVGLSWAFLRAGAHNAIGSLWEVSDASTPALMDSLYAGLQRGEAPASALRAAKLNLIHSNGRFSRPFYWAPFQLYSGR